MTAKVKPNQIDKPLNPMDPKNSNWDKALSDRITELENKFIDFEVNVFHILKSVLDEVEKEKINKELSNEEEDKKKDTKEVTAEVIERTETEELNASDNKNE